MLKKCQDFLAQLPLKKGDRILIALSGGRDSVALFRALLHLSEESYGGVGLEFSLAVAHFNHHSRGEESQSDQDFVENLLKPYENPRIIRLNREKEVEYPGIPCFVQGCDVKAQAKERKLGFEETARLLRYDFLQKVGKKVGATWIATAHNASDNAETLLLHLARGCGIGGLCGIPPQSGNLIRPMLQVDRSEIQQYLMEIQQNYRDDSTNADISYHRNRVRHQVLPVLTQVNPQFLSHCNNTIRIISEENNFLDSLVAQALPFEKTEKNLQVSVQSVRNLPDPLKTRGIQFLIQQMCSDRILSSQQRKQALALIHREKPSGKLVLWEEKQENAKEVDGYPQGLVQCSSLQMERHYDVLIFSPLSPLLSPQFEDIEENSRQLEEIWGLSATKTLYQGEKQQEDTLWLSVGEPYGVRSRQVGDTLKVENRPRKILKKWMIEAKIPQSIRDSVAILVNGENLPIGVMGLGVSQEYQPKQGEIAWKITKLS